MVVAARGQIAPACGRRRVITRGPVLGAMRARAAAFVTIALAAVVFARAVPEWIESTLRSSDAAVAATLGLSWTAVAVVLLAVGAAAVIAYGVAAAIVLWRGERAHA